MRNAFLASPQLLRDLNPGLDLKAVLMLLAQFERLHNGFLENRIRLRKELSE